MTSSPEDYWRIDEADFPAQDSLWKQMEFLLRYAILAPSGHNTQPWRFRLLEDHLVVLADRTRALPVVDPYDRELTISCGAAIGHFEVAAAH
ncbi:MAG: nitroreductase family protein, partial [Pseudomonadota bacterium]